MAPNKLAELPPELLSEVIVHLESASSIARLGTTSKSLRAFVEKDAWKGFCKTQFPTTAPQTDYGQAYSHTARTLTSLSQAFDRRAFIARYIEPRGEVTAFPQGKKLERWTRPRGQTIGFIPHLDVYEDISSTSREEHLAFSAGAEVCLGQTSRRKSSEKTAWTTYKPHSACEGRDDVTSLHLVRPEVGGKSKREIIIGTANGDLQLVTLPSGSDDQKVEITYFTTQGLPVRSSSLYQRPGQPAILAASLGESKIALYQIDREQRKIAPSSEMTLKPVLRADGNPSTQHRAWSTTMLSSSLLAAGVGPSTEPIHIYPITEAGITRDALRKFSLNIDGDKVDNGSSSPAGLMSSVYTIVPLPSSSDSSSSNVFLSGAYDGIVRLHDLRSSRDLEQSYIDPADDSAIYSILPRGQEKLLTGTSRHNLLKVFDLRLGKKCYDYRNASKAKRTNLDSESDFNIFLRSNEPPGQGNRGWQRNRTKESSVYSLASSSADSPYIYAGLENAIMSLAFTEILDDHPDSTFFDPWSSRTDKKLASSSRMVNEREVLSLAMYDQGSNMSLRVQRSPWETWQFWRSTAQKTRGKLDERWRSSADTGI
ncbi:unnamed protein product [Zymoseptoria tritici ST99CH_3D1]|nr:unnamed protein product [Zymoseptoria tritici ST99CH_3D1]